MAASEVDTLQSLEGPLNLTRKRLVEARHLPGDFYCSETIAALEKERIFMKSWLCVAHTAEIPNAGDFVTKSVTGEPILLTRGDDGNVNAVMNMCLHRGVPVADGSGNRKRFICPYHAWNYDLTGRLIAAPLIDKSQINIKEDCIGLRRLKIAQWRGWIFVNFDSEASNFESFIAQYEDHMWFFQTDEGKLASREVIKLNCNWKYTVENIIDSYHGPIVHGKSFGGYYEQMNEEKIKAGNLYNLLPQGGFTIRRRARPHSKSGRQIFTTLPWLRDKEGIDSDICIKAGMFPNLNLSLRYDSVRMWQVWPLTVDTCEVHLYTILAEESFQQPDFTEGYKEYMDFLLNAVINEDGPVIVALQKASSSKFFKPGPMCPLEAAVHHIMNGYLDVMTQKREPASLTMTAAE